MKTIAIIDYGMGNVMSVKKAFSHIAPNHKVILTHDANILNEADRIVFPGQGAMAGCMNVIKQQNLLNTIKQCAIEKPFLGICLGLQMLFETSEENGGTQGLSLLEGQVKKFPKNELKIPQIGWNKVNQTQQHPIWHNIPQESYFYNVHSYYVVEKDRKIVLGTTDYGLNYNSAIVKDNMIAVQFHPEKSQQHGLTLLDNFVQWSV
jgi:glutamine amidotransferase